MRFSLQVHYAICGVFDLAYNGQEESVRVATIGDRQAIPARYLEQIFGRLRKAGLVRGKRGPGGGYMLARAPGDITLKDIVEAVEGPVGGRDMGASSEARGKPAPHRPDFLWADLAERLTLLLAECTVEDLCRRAAQQGVTRWNVEAHTYQI